MDSLLRLTASCFSLYKSTTVPWILYGTKATLCFHFFQSSTTKRQHLHSAIFQIILLYQLQILTTTTRQQGLTVPPTTECVPWIVTTPMPMSFEVPSSTNRTNDRRPTYAIHTGPSKAQTSTLQIDLRNLYQILKKDNYAYFGYPTEEGTWCKSNQSFHPLCTRNVKGK